MKSDPTTHASLVLTTPAIFSLFGVSGVPNPDDPNDHGPWGPIIRRAQERVSLVFGSYPGRLLEFFDPVPDPWNAAFAQALAQEVMDRATFMQEVADALPQAGSQQGIIIIGGMVARFIDDCGLGRIKRGRVPHPPPRHGDDGSLGPFELVLMAAQFQQGAAGTTNEGLRREFGKAGEQLLEIGIGRLQSSAQAAST